MLVMTSYTKNLMFVQRVIMMTPCDMYLYNVRCSLRLMHTLCVVPPNDNHHSSQRKTEEQKAARWARDMLNYAKKHSIQKRSRKDIINGNSMKILDVDVTNMTTVDACDDQLHEELDVHTTGNNDDTHISLYNFRSSLRLMHS
jgi:hypothetical protein